MTFNLVRYLEPCIYRCAVSPRGYHPSISSQYFGTDMVYYMYLCLKFTLIKWCNLLKLMSVFLWNIGYYSRVLLFCLCPLVDMLIKTFKLLNIWLMTNWWSLFIELDVNVFIRNVSSTVLQYISHKFNISSLCCWF